MTGKQRLVFFLIIGLAAIVVLAGLALERLNVAALPWRRVSSAPIQVAVSPALQRWVEAAARDFGSRNPGAQVAVIAANSLDAAGQWAKMGAEARPHAWIPDATWVTAIAQEQELPFEAAGQSVAAADLVWGTFDNRRAVLVSKFGVLDWAAIQQAATSSGWGALGGDANWGYFKLIMAPPGRSAEGLAALLAAAAAYHNQPNLTYGQVNDAAFLEWLKVAVKSVPNFGTLGSDPAETLAARGPSVGDVGLLSAAAWKRAQAGLNKWGTFVTAVPQYTVRLDYPYLLRSDLTKSERDVAQRFGKYLAAAAAEFAAGQAGLLADEGFDAQATTSATVVQPDVQAVLGLYHWAQRERIGQ